MNKNIKKLTVIGMFSAVAFVLMFVQWGLPIMPSFVKMDVSDLPGLLATFMFGVPSGVAVCLIKNVLHLTVTSTAGVGELSNFLLGATLCVVAGLIYRYKRTRGGALVAMLCGSAASGAVSFFTNLLIVYPFYYNVMPKEAILGMYQVILPVVDSIEQALLVFNVPFTVAKGLLCSMVTFFLYKKLKKVLRLD